MDRFDEEYLWFFGASLLNFLSVSNDSLQSVLHNQARRGLLLIFAPELSAVLRF